MTEPGQTPGPPPSSEPTPIPPWAPPSQETAPPETAQEDTTRPAPVTPAAVPYSDVAATMRLIPVPPPSTPPPPLPALVTTPAPAADRYIGKYRVKGELGRGGMGAVYLAEQPGLGREVAIKELIQSATADPVALKRFLQEAQVMARTSHPNLVQVLVRGPMSPPQVFAVMHGVLQALDYAHRHAVVHRDMKPENVLLSDEGMVKVADFGIARLTDDTGVGGTATKTGTTVGTPQYMSPEQVASSKVDGRSDLYSAGIMFYELVVGQPPFTATEADGPFTLMAKHVQAPPKPPSVHRPGLDMELEGVILKALAKRPEDRFQTGQEFDEAIVRIADRLYPGWRRSLEPGADLSKMVPGATTPPGSTIGMAFPQSAAAVAAEAAYNPAPPVKPVAKSAGCLGVLVAVISSSGVLVLLAAALLH